MRAIRTPGAKFHEVSRDTSHDCDVRVLFRRTRGGRLGRCRSSISSRHRSCAACRRPASGQICGECLRAAAVAARAPLPALRAAPAPLRLPRVGRRVRPRVGAAGLRGRGARHRARAQVRRRAPARGPDGRAHGRQPPRRPAAPCPRAGPRAPRAAAPRGVSTRGAAADGLSRAAGLPLSPCLRRADRGRRQVGAGRTLRRSAGRFAAVATSAPPRAVVLVDDVHTTGATLDACARALKERGAEWVGAATYVRTL